MVKMIKKCFLLLFFFFVTTVLFYSHAFSFNKIKTKKQTIAYLDKGCYVIVGAFSYEDNAIRFSSLLKKNGFPANAGYMPEKQLYYVFLYKTDDIELARKKRNNYRKMEEFSDAWCLYYKINLNDTKPDPEVVVQKETVNRPVEKKEEIVKETITPEVKPEVKPEIKEEEVKKPAPLNANEVYLYANTVIANNFKEIPALVKVVDGANATLLANVPSNKNVKVRVPKNASRSIQLICEVFGYSKIENDLNITNPVTDSTRGFVKMKEDTIVVTFELQRYKMGERAIMYNVFFYDDAAVMLPKSKYELNSLLEMLNENPNYKIVIHGHTNGNSRGKIIYLIDDKNLFTLSPQNKIGSGPATELSLLRAESIRKFLLTQGVEKSRMNVKGWGGKQMLYDENSLDAKKNARVEIEIVADK